MIWGVPLRCWRLRVAGCLLSVVGYQLSVTSYELQVAGCLRFAVYAIGRLSPPFAV